MLLAPLASGISKTLPLTESAAQREEALDFNNQLTASSAELFPFVM